MSPFICAMRRGRSQRAFTRWPDGDPLSFQPLAAQICSSALPQMTQSQLSTNRARANFSPPAASGRQKTLAPSNALRPRTRQMVIMKASRNCNLLNDFLLNPLRLASFFQRPPCAKSVTATVRTVPSISAPQRTTSGSFFGPAGRPIPRIGPVELQERLHLC